MNDSELFAWAYRTETKVRFNKLDLREKYAENGSNDDGKGGLPSPTGAAAAATTTLRSDFLIDAYPSSKNNQFNPDSVLYSEIRNDLIPEIRNDLIAYQRKASFSLQKIIDTDGSLLPIDLYEGDGDNDSDYDDDDYDGDGNVSDDDITLDGSVVDDTLSLSELAQLKSDNTKDVPSEIIDAVDTRIFVEGARIFIEDGKDDDGDRDHSQSDSRKRIKEKSERSKKMKFKRTHGDSSKILPAPPNYLYFIICIESYAGYPLLDLFHGTKGDHRPTDIVEGPNYYSNVSGTR